MHAVTKSEMGLRAWGKVSATSRLPNDGRRRLKAVFFPLIVIAFVLSVIATARAQVEKDIDAIIERLNSNSIEVRTQASQEAFGAGIKSDALYQKIESVAEAGLKGMDKNSPRSNEIAWHIKALAGSGDIKYLPLIERASQSGVRSLARHAKDAKEILAESSARGAPYLLYTKVPILTEKQAERCNYVAQRTCKTSRSAEKCIAQHQSNAVAVGANAVVLLHSSSHSVGFGPFGGDTTMIANYYGCGEKQ